MLALLACGAIGAATHLLIMRPLRRRSALARLIATLGILTTIEGIAQIIYKANLTQVPGSLPSGLVTIFAGTTTAASTDASVVGILGDTAGTPEFIYDVICEKGITLQVGSGVAPLDITVSFR